MKEEFLQLISKQKHLFVGELYELGLCFQHAMIRLPCPIKLYSWIITLKFTRPTV